EPRELYQKPVNRFVADFVGGANFLYVERVGQQWQLRNGLAIEIDPMTDSDDGRSKIALLRPEAIRLDEAPAPAASGQHRLTGRVVGGMYLGPHVEYIVEVGADRLRAYSRHALAPGSPATLTFDARDCRLVDDMPRTEARSHHA